MGSERWSNGVLEWWSSGVLLGIFGDARDPILVVAFLFKLLDQSQKPVFDFIVKDIQFFKTRCCNLLCLFQPNRSCQCLGHRSERVIKELNVFAYRTPAVAFRDVRGN